MSTHTKKPLTQAEARDWIAHRFLVAITRSKPRRLTARERQAARDFQTRNALRALTANFAAQ